MEAFSFCLEIIRREGEKFNAGFDPTTASEMTAATATSMNYDIVHNRCSYLYRCGPINLSFARECLTKFFSGNKFSGQLIQNLILKSNLTLCSLSQGPALDCIAFLQSFQENYKFPLSFKNIRLISKYGAWRNTVNIMHQMIADGYNAPSIPKLFGNINVIQGDPFVNLTEKVKNPINESDVVIMIKTLNLQTDGYNPHAVISLIKAFLAALKEDALLFCIDTKPSIALISEAISAFNGTVLFQPTFVNTLIPLEQVDIYKIIYGCTPILSARGSLLVWQKKPFSLPTPSYLELNKLPEPVKTLFRAHNDSGYCDDMSKINCDKRESLNDSFYISTPNHLIQDKNKAFSLSESLKFETNQTLNDWLDTSTKNNGSIPSPSSYTNKCKLNDGVPADANLTHLLSATKSVQTVPEDSFDNFDSAKIVALTENISKLTQSLKSLLETNEGQDTAPRCQSCLKHKNSNAVNSVGSQCGCEHCSSKALHLNECCNEDSNSFCNYLDKSVVKHCSNHFNTQGSSLCNTQCSNESLINLKTTENCDGPLNGVKISVEQKNCPEASNSSK